MRKPDLRVKYVVEIEPLEFYDRLVPTRKSSRRWARDWRRHLDAVVREVFCVGPHSKAVKVYMVDADTGERIS